VVLFIRVVDLVFGGLLTMNGEIFRFGIMTTGWVLSSFQFDLELTIGWHPIRVTFPKQMTIGWACHPCHISKNWHSEDMLIRLSFFLEM